MRQYGDITKLIGKELEPVDIIVGGSPCQDLSIAGLRSGLDGNRSGLFLEMIRLITEMRKETNGEYPKYAIWENVTGAFSSNKGRDFKRVLEEFIRVKESDIPDLPVPNEGWHYCGSIVGDGWSIAWRTHDAQYWGVPQRRKRISLVADYTGRNAAKILFEPKSVSGDSGKSGTQRENTPARVENSSGTSIWCLQGNGIDRALTVGCNGCGWREDVAYTLNTVDRHAVAIDSNPTDARFKISGDKNQTIRRLTPLECERLQGYPDGWTDITGATDSKRYKALGNSIALPFWEHLAQRFAEITESKTIGSLFDGIGGFPLVFKRAGIKTEWTSEIDPFPIAVVEAHLHEN